MILTLSKNHECVMSNSYISSMLNISKVHASRLVSSLRDKGYVKVKIIYKENSKEILKRVITPINKCVNTYKHFRTSPINTDVKDILKKNNINYNNSTYDYQREYINYDFTKLYANNF